MGFTMPSSTGVRSISARPPNAMDASSTQSAAVSAVPPTAK